jgi:hypothetical protein
MQLNGTSGELEPAGSAGRDVGIFQPAPCEGLSRGEIISSTRVNLEDYRFQGELR